MELTELFSSPDFLAVPGVDVWLFAGLSLAAIATTFMGIIAGAAGGLVLLAIMSIFFPPGVLIPVHTLVQFGAGASRTILMWRHVMKGTLIPFILGSIVGAFAGGQIFISLSTVTLQAIVGVSILILAWMPSIGRFGPERGRFTLLGFGSTFLGVFVGATGSFLAPFVAAHAPDRQSHASTLAALMSVTHIAKFVAFTAIGLSVSAYAPLIVSMVVGAALGNWIGSKVLDRMPEKLFRIILKVVLTGLGLRLLWAAWEGSQG